MRLTSAQAERMLRFTLFDVELGSGLNGTVRPKGAGKTDVLRLEP